MNKIKSAYMNDKLINLKINIKINNNVKPINKKLEDIRNKLKMKLDDKKIKII
jgi:hypothetical protein